MNTRKVNFCTILGANVFRKSSLFIPIVGKWLCQVSQRYLKKWVSEWKPKWGGKDFLYRSLCQQSWVFSCMSRRFSADGGIQRVFWSKLDYNSNTNGNFPWHILTTSASIFRPQKLFLAHHVQNNTTFHSQLGQPLHISSCCSDSSPCLPEKSWSKAQSHCDWAMSHWNMLFVTVKSLHSLQ